MGLTPEQDKLLEETHKGFVRSGAALGRGPKARIMEINSEMAELSTQFGENVLAETNAYELLVTDSADLGGLPANLVTLAAERAQTNGHEAGWAFGLDRPSINPFLEYSTNRDLRRDIFMGYALRGDNDNDQDNKTILARMAALRAERAQIMGYPTHAHFISPTTWPRPRTGSWSFLEEVWRPALEVAKQERADMQEVMNAEGVPGKLEGWDWRHYTEKVRRARFALDQEALLPVLRGERRPGRRVHDRRATSTDSPSTSVEDLPRWHPDQQVFEVQGSRRQSPGRPLLDFFTRPSKRGGAWMNSLRSQSNVDGFVTPIVTTNFNFPPPTADGPSLIGLDNALTLAHEMGHALHGLMSNVTYESLSGTSVPRDFVEFGSQIMENWMGEPEVLTRVRETLRDRRSPSGRVRRKAPGVRHVQSGFHHRGVHRRRLPGHGVASPGRTGRTWTRTPSKQPRWRESASSKRSSPGIGAPITTISSPADIRRVTTPTSGPKSWTRTLSRPSLRRATSSIRKRPIGFVGRSSPEVAPVLEWSFM